MTVARVCDVCGAWPCQCRRAMYEPAVSAYAAPTVRSERCLCGGSIVIYDYLDWVHVGRAIRAHNRTTAHALWRREWAA